MMDLMTRIKKGHDLHCSTWETWQENNIDTQGKRFIGTWTGCRECGVGILHN